MPFSRTTYGLVCGPELAGAMRNIGLRIGSGDSQGCTADIEVTLVSCVREALPSGYRLLGVLMAWLERHHGRVNVPRLGRVLKQVDASPIERAIWASVGHWLGQVNSRFLALQKLHKGAPVSLEGDPDITRLGVARHGPDPRFRSSALRVHAKLLRSRPADVDTVAQVAAQNSTYRARLIHGPNHRADIWAQLERDSGRSFRLLARSAAPTKRLARSQPIGGSPRKPARSRI